MRHFTRDDQTYGGNLVVRFDKQPG